MAFQRIARDSRFIAEGGAPLETHCALVHTRDSGAGGACRRTSAATRATNPLGEG